MRRVLRKCLRFLPIPACHILCATSLGHIMKFQVHLSTTFEVMYCNKSNFDLTQINYHDQTTNTGSSSPPLPHHWWGSKPWTTVRPCSLAIQPSNCTDAALYSTSLNAQNRMLRVRLTSKNISNDRIVSLNTSETKFIITDYVKLNNILIFGLQPDNPCMMTKPVLFLNCTQPMKEFNSVKTLNLIIRYKPYEQYKVQTCKVIQDETERPKQTSSP